MQEISIVVAVSEAQLQSVLSAIFRFNGRTRAVFSQATSPLELAADCRGQEADLVIVDSRLVYAAHDLVPVVTFYPQAHLMVFVDVGASEAIQGAINAGARGILTSDASAQEIQTAVSDVMAGHVFLSRTALLWLLEVCRRNLPPVQPALALPRTDLPPLTSRERQVVECLGKGHSNRDIARELGVSETSIKGHLSRIMAKWCVQDRLQVLVTAFEAGVLRVGVLGDEVISSESLYQASPAQKLRYRPKSTYERDDRTLLRSAIEK